MFDAKPYYTFKEELVKENSTDPAGWVIEFHEKVPEDAIYDIAEKVRDILNSPFLIHADKKMRLIVQNGSDFIDSTWTSWIEYFIIKVLEEYHVHLR